MKFFFHYNKPASKLRGRPVISLHFRNKCHLVEALDCRVPTQSKIREEQPRFVMEGVGEPMIFTTSENFTYAIIHRREP